MSRLTPFRSAVLMVLAMALTGTAPLWAQAEPQEPFVAAVVNALGDAGLHAGAAQIELPSPVLARKDSPQLQVSGAELLGDGHLRVRLVCRQAGQCPPFLALVRSGYGGASLADLASVQSSLHSKAAALPGHEEHRLLAGQHATLLLEDQRMRISVPVIVIDSGLPGTQVRVTSLDRKQNYHAVVADATTVRGQLP